MSLRIGKRAVVVGAGMGGLAAARVLADHFDRVTVLERDVLPADGSPRSGIPQGRHVHVLLAGGQRALTDLFPALEQRLLQNGAVPVRVDRDMRREIAGRPALPQRDLGFHFLSQSRPRLEATVRERVGTLANVTLESKCRVRALTSSDDGQTVDGVRYIGPDGRNRELGADLVIEATGRGNLTLAFLEETRRAQPETTSIGVDLGYSTAVFEIPDDAPSDWKGVFIYPAPPQDSRGALLMPLEGERWILTLAGRVGEEPPGDAAGFMDFAANLHSRTIYDAVSKAKRVGEIGRYRFPASTRRHYARLESFPRGLLPIGDALCRFNPVYGQGMSVAAQEAHALGRLLRERAAERDPLDGLAAAFFDAADGIVETPWRSSALPDLAYPSTVGERPADFERRIKQSTALNALAAADADINKLLLEVRHLLKPHTALEVPWLTQRLEETMAQ